MCGVQLSLEKVPVYYRSNNSDLTETNMTVDYYVSLYAYFISELGNEHKWRSSQIYKSKCVCRRQTVAVRRWLVCGNRRSFWRASFRNKNSSYTNYNPWTNLASRTMPDPTRARTHSAQVRATASGLENSIWKISLKHLVSGLILQKQEPDDVPNTECVWCVCVWCVCVCVCVCVCMCVCVSDCSQLFSSGSKSSGFYRIKPHGSPSPVRVYCDMNDGGGWIVIQRRINGTEKFNRCVCDIW